MSERPPDGARIFIVSDSTGETAHQTARAAMAQFRPQEGAEIRVFPRTRTEAAVRGVLELAKERGALVVYTTVED